MEQRALQQPCLSISCCRSLKKEDGDILVTGGTGGVATIAAKILVKLGFDVVMATGKAGSQQEALMKLGIKSVVSRETLQIRPGSRC
jgi:acrylyl-CoA reductase (NADPH)